MRLGHARIRRRDAGVLSGFTARIADPMSLLERGYRPRPISDRSRAGRWRHGRSLSAHETRGSTVTVAIEVAAQTDFRAIRQFRAAVRSRGAARFRGSRTRTSARCTTSASTTARRISSWSVWRAETLARPAPAKRGADASAHEALAIAIQIADALSRAHRAGRRSP